MEQLELYTFTIKVIITKFLSNQEFISRIISYKYESNFWKDALISKSTTSNNVNA
jgi:hypothetical protein